MSADEVGLLGPPFVQCVVDILSLSSVGVDSSKNLPESRLRCCACLLIRHSQMSFDLVVVWNLRSHGVSAGSTQSRQWNIVRPTFASEEAVEKSDRFAGVVTSKGGFTSDLRVGQLWGAVNK